MEIIRLESVSRKFGDFLAVDNISFSLEPLTINGFLGPNGAGKTTTIKMMCGLLKPSSGKIILQDIDVINNPELAREKIGYMSQNFSLYPDLTAEENILFFADLYRINSKGKKDRFEEVVELLKLKNYLKDITGALPLGIKQRIALASATIHKPSILFLDEPTSGVDPISRIEFFEYIKNYIKTYNATVVLSTHFLNEAEYCDSIFLFNRGKIILSGRPSKIIKEFEYQILEINSTADREKAMDNLKDIEGIIEKYIYGKKIRIIITKDYNVDKLATHLNINKENIKVANTSLEDIFIRLTND